MEQIRKGNDTKVYWEIITGGDGSEIPYELEGKSLELYAQNAYEKVRISDFVANGNVIEWTFYGKDQKTAGVYSLTLIENNGSEGMRTVDECNAFELVTHSCKAGGDAESRVSIETVRLRSVMTLSDVVPDKELNKNSTNVVENGAIAREFEKQNDALAKKQDIIPDLAIIREGASKGATALQEHQDISGKADTSGRYPDMSVGFSDDLVGRGESVPAEFSFRASGGKSIKDGTARIKRLKGNSVVWNNMVDTRGYEGQLFISTGIRIVKGHKYLLYRTETNQSLYLIAVVNGAENYEMSIREGEHSGIFQAQYSDDNGQGTVYSEGYCGACVISDLTKMFQAGNEPTTIEEFNARKPIVEDEYAYNEGQVIHCNTESIKSVGDNAWDEQWENGTFDITSGEAIDGSWVMGQIRSENPLPVLPNEEYYVSMGKGSMWVIFLDKEGNAIESPAHNGLTAGNAINVGNGRTFKTPTNAAFLIFYCTEDYGTTYNHDILISLYHSGWKAQKDDQYQPYWQDTLPLPIILKYFPDGMKKAGSAHDEIRYNKASGKWEAVQRIGSVDMGKLSWNYGQPSDNYPYGYFYKTINEKEYGDNLLCAKYTLAPSVNPFSIDKHIFGANSNKIVYIIDSAYTDVASFKADLQGLMLYYELATPIVTELDAEDQNFRDYYNVADFGTEEAIPATDAEGNIIPSAAFSADIIYQFNAVDMIREHELEITELQRIIATMQAQLTSLTSNNGGQ